MEFKIEGSLTQEKISGTMSAKAKTISGGVNVGGGIGVQSVNNKLPDAKGNVQIGGELETGNAELKTVKEVADEVATLNDSLSATTALSLLGGGDDAGSGVTEDKVNELVSLGISTYSDTTSKTKGLKLCTIGDSVTASNLWQPWIKKWGQLIYDDAETLLGVSGGQPLAVGGTTIRPFTNSGGVSIYTRGKDAVIYNPDIITILVTGNDGLTYEGSINDAPYTGSENPTGAASSYTCYSAYMGLVEYLLKNLKSAKIVLVSNMVPRIDFNNDYDYAKVVNYNTLYRKPWADMAKSIANKYHLTYVDLYNESSVNELNCQPYYSNPSNIGSPTGLVYQIHPNAFGYKKMAEIIFNKL